MRVIKKSQGMLLMQESVISRTRLLLNLESLDQVYSLYKIPVPDKVQISQYLVHQFEFADFDFHSVHKEEKLMDDFEELVRKELRILGGPKG